MLVLNVAFAVLFRLDIEYNLFVGLVKVPLIIKDVRGAGGAAALPLYPLIAFVMAICIDIPYQSATMFDAVVAAYICFTFTGRNVPAGIAAKVTTSSPDVNTTKFPVVPIYKTHPALS